jgi:hypothetical protein
LHYVKTFFTEYCIPFCFQRHLFPVSLNVVDCHALCQYTSGLHQIKHYWHFYLPPFFNLFKVVTATLSNISMHVEILNPNLKKESKPS